MWRTGPDPDDENEDMGINSPSPIETWTIGYWIIIMVVVGAVLLVSLSDWIRSAA
jgi:hypothetical protein